MRRTALAIALTFVASLAHAQQVNDIQLRQGSSSLWGASFNANNNQVIDQFNTAGSVVDSFRWFQGTSAAQGTQLWSLSTTGHIAGAATGGRKGAGTINTTGVFVNGVSAITGLGGTNGQIQYNNAGVLGGFTTSGDATINTGTGALTLATVNGNVGTFGSATTCITTTANAKGLITAISAATCTPALGSITGLGTGVPAALAINIGSAGAPVLFNGAGGTPTSLVGTNITGTAAGLTAGTFTAGSATNLTSGTLPAARMPALTGDITSTVGTVATTLAAGSASNLNSGTLASARGGAGTINGVLAGNGSGVVSQGTCAGLSGVAASCATDATNASNITTGTLPTARLSLAPITNSLGANVALNNTANYFDGPSVAQGSTGTWWAAGTVTANDTAGAANIQCKLWDGTTVISSGQASISAVNLSVSFGLSGFITSPAGNIRISCKDAASTSGNLLFNATGNSKDSTVSAFRIN